MFANTYYVCHKRKADFRTFQNSGNRDYFYLKGLKCLTNTNQNVILFEEN